MLFRSPLSDPHAGAGGGVTGLVAEQEVLPPQLQLHVFPFKVGVVGVPGWHSPAASGEEVKLPPLSDPHAGAGGGGSQVFTQA